VDVIFEQPYCRIANLVQAGIVERQAASRYLKALASIGVLSEQAFGREKLVVHPKLMTLLTRRGNPSNRIGSALCFACRSVFRRGCCRTPRVSTRPRFKQKA